jgi:hypothetical protein
MIRRPAALLPALLALLLAGAAAAQSSTFYRFNETGASRTVRLYVAEGARDDEMRVIMLLSGVYDGYYDITVRHNCGTPVDYGERGRFHWWGTTRSQDLDPFAFSNILREQLGAADGQFHRMMVCDAAHVRGTRVLGLLNVLVEAREWSMAN